jgi:beta-aspartyl-peptidase (threonine type)
LPFFGSAEALIVCQNTLTALLDSLRMRVWSVQKPVIVVQGGAGAWEAERWKEGLVGVKKATEVGFEFLKAGRSAVDAVEAAVMSMEDNKTFNAGLGSTLALDKRIEMEASIMEGKTLNAGATGLLRDIKNPIHLARLIMENTDHVFLVADGAEKLANLYGLERRNPMTELRLRYWCELTQKLKDGEIESLRKLEKLLRAHPSLFATDTVGAVALDKKGNTAAATSTGGRALKLPGRIGDSPLIGCGTYADNEAGACSTTGIGEVAIRLVLAKTACDLMRANQSAQMAADNSIRLVNRRIRLKSSMGLITVDTKGRVGAAHNTPNLCWAYMTSKLSQPRAAMQAKVLV